MKVCKFLDAAQLDLHVTVNLTGLPRITIKIIQMKLMATDTESLVNK